MSYQPIEETEVYELACDVADRLYRLIRQWGAFDQDTMGKQLVRSLDSMGANLVEGDGRKSDPDSSRFFRYARSSARESRHWIKTAARREVLESDIALVAIEDVTRCVRMISGLLRYRATAQIKEERSSYDDPFVDAD